MRMPLVRLAALLALGAAPATARTPPPAESGPVLWDTLQTGMTAREVRGHLRHSSVYLTPLCVGTVHAYYSRDRLIRVELTGRNAFRSGPLCSERVRKTLTDTYGASDGSLHNALEDRAWVYTGPSPLPRLFHPIDAGGTLFEAWSTKDKSVLFRSRRRGGGWTVDYVPNALPVQNTTAL